MTTVFPLFQQYIEPHLIDAHVGTRNMNLTYLIYIYHLWLSIIMYLVTCLDSRNVPSPRALQLKIQNDFDPVLSPESSLFVLKSKKQVSLSFILFILLLRWWLFIYFCFMNRYLIKTYWKYSMLVKPAAVSRILLMCI